MIVNNSTMSQSEFRAQLAVGSTRLLYQMVGDAIDNVEEAAEDYARALDRGWVTPWEVLCFCNSDGRIYLCFDRRCVEYPKQIEIHHPDLSHLSAEDAVISYVEMLDDVSNHWFSDSDENAVINWLIDNWDEFMSQREVN